MIIPIVNMNGDEKKTLVDQNRTVFDALTKALQAIADAAPHGRNFQLNEPGEYGKAREQFNQNYQTLENLRREYSQLIIAIQNQ